MSIETTIEEGKTKAQRLLKQKDFYESTTRNFSGGAHPTGEMVKLYEALAEGLGMGYAISEHFEELIKCKNDSQRDTDKITAHALATRISSLLQEQTTPREPFRHNGVLTNPSVEGIINDFVSNYHKLTRKKVLRDQQQVIRFAAEYFTGIEEQLKETKGAYELKIVPKERVIIGTEKKSDGGFLLDRPTRTLEDVIGLEEIKEVINRKIINVIKNEEQWHRLKKNPDRIVDSNNYLFLGSPGTGKTYFAECLAGEVSYAFFAATGSDFVQMYHGEGKNMLTNLFKRAQEHKPSILFIDEADCLFMKRGSSGSEHKLDVITQYLALIDGIRSNAGVISICATNMDKESMDRATLDRFPPMNRILFPEQNPEQIMRIFDYHLGLTHHKELNRKERIKLQEHVAGHNPRYISHLIQDARTRTLMRGDEKITYDDLLASSEYVRKCSEN